MKTFFMAEFESPRDSRGRPVPFEKKTSPGRHSECRFWLNPPKRLKKYLKNRGDNAPLAILQVGRHSGVLRKPKFRQIFMGLCTMDVF